VKHVKNGYSSVKLRLVGRDRFPKQNDKHRNTFLSSCARLYFSTGYLRCPFFESLQRPWAKDIGKKRQSRTTKELRTILQVEEEESKDSLSSPLQNRKESKVGTRSRVKDSPRKACKTDTGT
jgi:hypothetical protein